MVSLQSQHSLAIFQLLLRSFQELKQNIYESTLWVCDRDIPQPFHLNLQQTETLLILKIQFDRFRSSLDLEITPETVLVRGERLDRLETQNYSEAEFPASRFQSLIPLPSSIQPETVIAELSGTTLTLTMTKSYETQRTFKTTVSDRNHLLPYAVAIWQSVQNQ